MRSIITCKKLKQSDFELMKAALNNYASSLQLLQEVMPKPKEFMKDLSITVELWYDINMRTAQQNPPENSKLNLSIHKAMILLDALYEMRSQKSTQDYERNRCNRFIMAIDEQMLTTTQLLTKLNS
ncbi:hypothetical protein ACNKXS_03320 [Christiangramia marina]|uniref:hypothetical protein n=1 Tax=Christiangramia marina TaxID=409436 RepID=UPI003AA9B517